MATLLPGKYKFEVTGAAGGKSGNTLSPGGNGGYSVGYYENFQPVTTYFFVGGKGHDGSDYANKDQNTPGGYNGGGYGGYDSQTNSKSGGGGGGSSDIRIGSKDVTKRIIVAGGGGGGCVYNPGGNGGGLQGSDGNARETNGRKGYGANQNSGGTAYTSRGASEGKLLNGGNGSGMISAYGGGGGGSGYYGGGGGSSSVDHQYGGYCGSGGGGSGYIGGVQNSDEYSIIASTTTSSNTGNGVIKITVLSSLEFVRINSINDCEFLLQKSIFLVFVVIVK